LAFTGFEVIRHRFARRRFVTTNDFIFAIGSENLWLGERSPRWRGPPGEPHAADDPVIPGRRAAANPESRADHGEIPRCALHI
jgi:hypothetical protein